MSFLFFLLTWRDQLDLVQNTSFRSCKQAISVSSGPLACGGCVLTEIACLQRRQVKPAESPPCGLVPHHISRGACSKRLNNVQNITITEMFVAVIKMQLTHDIAAAIARVDSLVLSARASATTDSGSSDDDEADVFAAAQWHGPVYAVRSTRRHTVPSGSTQLLHTIGIFGVLAIGHSISLVSVWLDLFQFRAHDASCFTNWHYARLLRKKLRRTRPLQTPMLWRCLLQTRLLQRRYAIIVS